MNSGFSEGLVQKICLGSSMFYSFKGCSDGSGLLEMRLSSGVQ
jgi:hypothetical protein